MECHYSQAKKEETKYQIKMEKQFQILNSKTSRVNINNNFSKINMFHNLKCYFINKKNYRLENPEANNGITTKVDKKVLLWL